jgi:hypothetical protein
VYAGAFSDKFLFVIRRVEQVNPDNFPSQRLSLTCAE